MKKIQNALLVGVSFLLFISCAGIQFTGTAKDLIEQIAGKRLAYELAYQNPELIKDGIEFCDLVLEADTNIEFLIGKGLERLRDEVGSKGDKMLVSDLELIMGQVQIDGKYDFNKVKNFVVGFKKGLELRK